MTAKANPGETKPGNFTDKEMTRSIEPAANREGGDTSPPAGHEQAEGSRGKHSGVNQEQDAQVSGKP